MAAVLNPQLAAMLAALDGAAAGLANEFVAHVGSTMAMAATMPADWFPGVEVWTIHDDFQAYYEMFAIGELDKWYSAQVGRHGSTYTTHKPQCCTAFHRCM